MTTYASPTYTANYQGLCNKIADVLNRQDLITAIPDFTVLATARISRDLARIRHPGSILLQTAALTANYSTLPTDFISMYQLMSGDGSMTYEYITPDQSKLVLANGWGPPDSPFPPTAPYMGQTTGPYYFTIIGNTLRILPAPSVSGPQTVDIWYFAKVPGIDAVTTTNWALTRYPDLYLYGSLVHSAPYLKADERIQVWEGAYQTILADIAIEAEQAMRPQSKLVAARRSFG